MNIYYEAIQYQHKRRLYNLEVPADRNDAQLVIIFTKRKKQDRNNYSPYKGECSPEYCSTNDQP